MERNLLLIGVMLAVALALLMFWEMSQNGRYTIMDQGGGLVLIFDTRTWEVRVRRVVLNDYKRTYKYISYAPDEQSIRP
jgi:hypothetical protein